MGRGQGMQRQKADPCQAKDRGTISKRGAVSFCPKESRNPRNAEETLTGKDSPQEAQGQTEQVGSGCLIPCSIWDLINHNC